MTFSLFQRLLLLSACSSMAAGYWGRAGGTPLSPSSTKWCHWRVYWLDQSNVAHACHQALQHTWSCTVNIHVYWLGSWWRWGGGGLASVMDLPWYVLSCFSMCTPLFISQMQVISGSAMDKMKDFTVLVDFVSFNSLYISDSLIFFACIVSLNVNKICDINKAKYSQEMIIWLNQIVNATVHLKLYSEQSCFQSSFTFQSLQYLEAVQ